MLKSLRKYYYEPVAVKCEKVEEVQGTSTVAFHDIVFKGFESYLIENLVLDTFRKDHSSFPLLLQWVNTSESGH